jgi:hypothetical protein
MVKAMWIGGIIFVEFPEIKKPQKFSIEMV